MEVGGGGNGGGGSARAGVAATGERSVSGCATRPRGVCTIWNTVEPGRSRPPAAAAAATAKETPVGVALAGDGDRGLLGGSAVVVACLMKMGVFAAAVAATGDGVEMICTSGLALRSVG